jgi:peroxiredoxin
VATVAVGDKLPDAMLSYFDPADGELKTVTVGELTAGKKAVLFAVPGAFTPTCSQKHLPGFVEKAGELKA